MTIAQDLVEEARRWLDSGSPPALNRLNGAVNSSVTTVTLEFTMGSVVPGAILAIDLEHMYVWSVAGQVATVQRGYAGTTAAAHLDDAMVYVNPLWSNFTIFTAINEELLSLSSPINGLFQIKTVDLTYSSARTGYDLTSVTDLLDVYDIRADSPGGFKNWPRITRWRLARNQSTSEFASGFALHLFEPAFPGRTMRIQYKARFTPFAALADNLTVTGLPATAADLPPLGALVRLVAPREIKRSITDSQPESRAATEVPPGTSRSTAAGLMQLRQLRIKEEAARLASQYPPLIRRSA